MGVVRRRNCGVAGLRCDHGRVCARRPSATHAIDATHRFPRRPLCVHATRCLAARATYTTWRRVVDALAPDVSETELTLIRRWCYAPKRHVMDCTEGLHSTLVKAAGCVEIKQ